MPPDEPSPTTADYLALLPGETEEVRFLRSVPWVLDAGPQDREALIRDLRDEAPRLAALPRRPRFSLLTPMYNTPPRLLRELILSVRCQSWPLWELLLVDDGSPRKDHLDTAREWANRDPRIKLFAREENKGISGARNDAIDQSSGDFLAILDHDDLLHPMALGQYARVLNADRDANLIFSNECQIDDAGTRTYGYFYKPQFDLFTLLRANYVCHFTAIRRDLLMEARRDGRVFRSEFDGAEDHDLFARLAMTGRVESRHVPLFLYFWRAVPTSCSMSLDAKPEIPERRIGLLEELLPQIYPGGTFRASHPDHARGQLHMTIRIRSLDLGRRPSLLVVVPAQDDPVRLIKALRALEAQRHDLDVTVVVARANSTEPGTAEAIDDWIAEPRSLRYEHAAFDGPHHASTLVNAAVERFGAGADLVLMLRPDVEPRSSEALQTMAMQLLADPSCGVVGLKLVAEDGRTVRHAGIKVLEDLDGSGYPRAASPTLGRDYLHDERVALGVSLGCAMTRRETFAKVGGLDEVLLTTTHGDLDFCAKAIAAGLRNYYFGTLSAVDHGPEAPCGPEFERAVLHERHASVLAAHRLRRLTHASEPIWPTVPPPPPPAPAAVPVAVEAAEPIVVLVPQPFGPLPVRYRVADSVNSGLKRVLGPFHGVIRSGMAGTWRTARRLRAGGEAGPTYRPMFARWRSRAPRA